MGLEMWPMGRIPRRIIDGRWVLTTDCEQHTISHSVPTAHELRLLQERDGKSLLILWLDWVSALRFSPLSVLSARDHQAQ